METLQGMLPVNVEGAEVARMRAVLQHVHQHGVLRVESHVVGHDVLQPAHPLPAHLFRQQSEVATAAELRIDGVHVGDVITVVAAAARAEDGGGIEGVDPQFPQVAKGFAGMIEGKSRRKLHAVARGRYAHQIIPTLRECPSCWNCSNHSEDVVLPRS